MEARRKPGLESRWTKVRPGLHFRQREERGGGRTERFRGQVPLAVGGRGEEEDLQVSGPWVVGPRD